LCQEILAKARIRLVMWGSNLRASMFCRGLLSALAFFVWTEISRAHTIEQPTLTANGLQANRTRLRGILANRTRLRGILDQRRGERKAALAFAQRRSHRSRARASPGLCRGGKLRWWINIKAKCHASYGPQSKWDRSRLDGWCREAWGACNTPAYTSCCTQPEGPKTLRAYCTENQSLERNDTACEVEPVVNALAVLVRDIKSGIIATEEPSQQMMYIPGPAPAPAPLETGPSPAPAKQPPAPAPANASSTVSPEAKKPAAAAASRGVPPGLEVQPGAQAYPEPEVEGKCDRIKALVTQAKKRIASLFDMLKEGSSLETNDKGAGMLLQEVPIPAPKFGTNPLEMDVSFDHLLPQGLERSDPDLAWQLKDLFKSGSKLLYLDDNDYCSEVDLGDDEDDDEETTSAQDPYEEEDLDLWVNETKLMELFDWVVEMGRAIHDLQTKVHPHGTKWWRYRYEYTFFESFCLAGNLAGLNLVTLVLHNVSNFVKHRYFKTGLPWRFYRYSIDYLVFHGCAISICVFVAWMLQAFTPVYGMIQQAVMDVNKSQFHVPLVGVSYFNLNIGVLFQLFLTYAIYVMFLGIIQRNYIKALRDWKLMSQTQLGDPLPEGVNKFNAELYESYSHSLRRRVADKDSYQQLLQQNGLRIPGTSGPGDQHEFKLHVYLTDALGESMEYLVKVSRATDFCLCLLALGAGYCALYFKLAFMYLLAPFCVLAMVLVAIGWLLTRYARYAEAHDKDVRKVPWLTVHGFTRGLQVVLYWIFYSFSRLLLSDDIWRHYSQCGIAAVCALTVFMVFLYAVAADVMKQTVCVLMLPPQVSNENFQKGLEQNVEWSTIPKCCEFGTDYLPEQMVPSLDWAKKSMSQDALQENVAWSAPRSYR